MEFMVLGRSNSNVGISGLWDGVYAKYACFTSYFCLVCINAGGKLLTLFFVCLLKHYSAVFRLTSSVLLVYGQRLAIWICKNVYLGGKCQSNIQMQFSPAEPRIDTLVQLIGFASSHNFLPQAVIPSKMNVFFDFHEHAET